MGDVFGKDSSPPPAPDYTGAAIATAAGNADAARIAAKANRVSQYTPYGNSIYTDLGNDLWRQDVTLAPTQQKLLDYQNNASLGLGSLTEKGLGYVSDMLDNPFDTSQLAAKQVNPGQSYQDAIMSRLQPQWDRKQQQLETQLVNQGITDRGSEAWGNALNDFNQARNDAEVAATLQGMGFGQQARQQDLQEQAFLRNEPLNTLNAVRTGSQVTNPTFSNVPQQQTTAGPNLLGAAQAQGQYDQGVYNSQVASDNAMMNGLFTLGSAALMAPKGTFAAVSDRRLKRNIRKIGEHKGLNVYAYDYVWGEPSVGVMADEVEHIPGAVITHSSGYKMVDYSKVI